MARGPGHVLWRAVGGAHTRACAHWRAALDTQQRHMNASESVAPTSHGGTSISVAPGLSGQQPSLEVRPPQWRMRAPPSQTPRTHGAGSLPCPISAPNQPYGTFAAFTRFPPAPPTRLTLRARCLPQITCTSTGYRGPGWRPRACTCRQGAAGPTPCCSRQGASWCQVR